MTQDSGSTINLNAGQVIGAGQNGQPFFLTQGRTSNVSLGSTGGGGVAKSALFFIPPATAWARVDKAGIGNFLKFRLLLIVGIDFSFQIQTPPYMARPSPKHAYDFSVT